MKNIHPPTKKGFTLIELLIVVAIIAILAAIAVPNFLEAQTRSKVSRVKADMRTTAIAIESYWVDYLIGPTDSGNGSYPIYRPYAGGQVWTADPRANFTLGFEVTTPIAYLSSASAFKDVFKAQRADIVNNPGLSGRDHYNFANWVMREKVQNVAFTTTKNNMGLWVLWGAGPDRFTNTKDFAATVDFQVTANIPYRISYDPTNGTVSIGDVFRSQKFGDGIAQQVPLP